MIRRLERISLQATRALSVLGLTALMVLAVMTLADGLLRWLANAPISGVRDIGALAIALTVACCLPVGLSERRHVTFRLFSAIAGDRAGRALDAVAAVVVLVVMVLLAREFWIFAGKLARVGETTWILKLPTAPFWYGVAAILWVAVAVQAIAALSDIMRAFRGAGSADGEET